MTKRFQIPGISRDTILPMSSAGTLPHPMQQATTISAAHKQAVPSRYFRRVLTGLAAIALLSAGGWTYYNRHLLPVPPAVIQPVGDYISNDQLEAQYGVRVTLISVIAVGGIVDFRYKVVDPAKADILLHNPDNAPVLTAMDSGLTLTPTQMSRHHKQMSMKRGAVPFNFYPNVRNAVKAGTPVSVAFGKIKVEPIAAQ